MKKSILILGVSLAFVGCKQQGGTSDQYSTDQSTSSSITNMRNTGASTYTGPNTNNQGAASSVGGTNTGSSTSATSTNSEGTRPTKP